MIQRRGLFGMLLGLPALASAAQESVAVDVPITSQAEPVPVRKRLGHDLFQKMEIDLEGKEYQVMVPPHIANKKSWSDTFKYGQALKEYKRLRSFRRQLDDIWFGDENQIPGEQLLKLRKLASERGLL